MCPWGGVCCRYACEEKKKEWTETSTETTIEGVTGGAELWVVRSPTAMIITSYPQEGLASFRALCARSAACPFFISWTAHPCRALPD